MYKSQVMYVVLCVMQALLSQDSEKDPSDASPSDHSSTVTATTSTCGSTTTTSVEAGEKSDSDPGVESRQSNDVIAAGVVHSECPYSKVASPKSNPSDPDSNLSSPGTRHKSDTSLSRYYTCIFSVYKLHICFLRRGTGLGGTGRGHRSILSALGGGGGGGGSLEGAPGEQETPRGEGSGEKDPHTLSMSNTGSGNSALSGCVCCVGVIHCMCTDLLVSRVSPPSRTAGTIFLYIMLCVSDNLAPRTNCVLHMRPARPGDCSCTTHKCNWPYLFRSPSMHSIQLVYISLMSTYTGQRE